MTRQRAAALGTTETPKHTRHHPHHNLTCRDPSEAPPGQKPTPPSEEVWRGVFFSCRFFLLPAPATINNLSPSELSPGSSKLWRLAGN